MTPPDIAAVAGKLTKAEARLTDGQSDLLDSFWQSHDEGLRSPPYYDPFGIGRLHLGGQGQKLVGLLKRGLVEDRNNIFYISSAGLALRQHLLENGGWVMKITKLKKGYRIILTDSEFEVMDVAVQHGVTDLLELGQDHILSAAAKRALRGRFTDQDTMRVDEDRRS
jgi:hypothetical protein